MSHLNSSQRKECFFFPKLSPNPESGTMAHSWVYANEYYPKIWVCLAVVYGPRDREKQHRKDGNLRMSTLISQFSGACGLRFRNKETGAMRGVRVNNDLFLPPNGAMGWPTDVTFNVVYRFVYNCYRLTVRP